MEESLKNFLKKIEHLKERIPPDEYEIRQEISLIKDYWQNVLVKGLEEERALWMERLKVKDEEIQMIKGFIEEKKKGWVLEDERKTHLITEFEWKTRDLEQRLETRLLEEEKIKMRDEQAFREKLRQREEEWRHLQEAKEQELRDIRWKLQKHERGLRIEDVPFQVKLKFKDEEIAQLKEMLREKELGMDEIFQERAEKVREWQEQYNRKEKEVRELQKRLEEMKDSLSMREIERVRELEKDYAELKTQLEEYKKQFAAGEVGTGIVQEKELAYGEGLKEREAMLKKEFGETEKKIREEYEKKEICYKDKFRQEMRKVLCDNNERIMRNTKILARGFSDRLRNYMSIISSIAQFMATGATGIPDVDGQKIRPGFRGILDRMKNLLLLGKKKEKEVPILKELNRNINTIVENIEKTNQAIEEYLALCRIMQLDLEPQPINVILDETLLLVGDRCINQNVGVEKEFAEDVPLTLLDPRYMKEAFLELFFNSLDAMPDRGTLTLKTSYEKARKEIEIRIIDTGSGISEAYLRDQKIYQPFFSTKKGRDGLGLPKVRRILDFHQQTISIESRKDKGTIVTIIIPTVKIENQ